MSIKFGQSTTAPRSKAWFGRPSSNTVGSAQGVARANTETPLTPPTTIISKAPARWCIRTVVKPCSSVTITAVNLKAPLLRAPKNRTVCWAFSRTSYSIQITRWVLQFRGTKMAPHLTPVSKASIPWPMQQISHSATNSSCWSRSQWSLTTQMETVGLNPSPSSVRILITVRGRSIATRLRRAYIRSWWSPVEKLIQHVQAPLVALGFKSNANTVIEAGSTLSALL